MSKPIAINRRKIALSRKRAPSKSVCTTRHLVMLALSLLALFTAVSCSSISTSKLVTAGSLLLQHELDNNYREEFNRYWRTGADWQGTPASEGKLDPERMPDWARDQYVACVYWEDEYHTESTISQPGPDMIRIRHGVGWGWILLSKDLEFHILETNLRWTISEDGVETESESQRFINAWDDPESGG